MESENKYIKQKIKTFQNFLNNFLDDKTISVWFIDYKSQNAYSIFGKNQRKFVTKDATFVHCRFYRKTENQGRCNLGT